MSTRRGGRSWLRRLAEIREPGEGAGGPPVVTLYTRPGCSLCVKAKSVLLDVRAEIPFVYREIDVSGDGALESRYGTEIPVVLVDGRKLFKYRVDPARLRKSLRAGMRT